ncbi:MAG: geranylgeranylglycerol-phosphate geranylgeranyltransferase [Candidatus Bathyarchaeia archaeon]
MRRLSGFLRLTRPINCFMMGLAVIVGASLVGPSSMSPAWPRLVYGFITGFTLTAASMAINDYYDRKIDAVNEPRRPIPSGLVKPGEAFVFALILAIVGLVAAYLTNTAYPLCLPTAIIAWIISVAYTTVGKRSGLPGNFLVSLCVSIPFVYGSVAVANEVKLNVLLFASIVFLSITGREITKGIVDVQGDRTQNVKTLAVRYGEKNAAVAAALFYLSAVGLSPTPWLLGIVSFWYIPLVAVTDIGLTASSLMLLKNYSRENSRKIKNTVLLWFIFGLLAFIIGAAT